MSKPDAELSADRLGAALEAALQIKDHIAPALADDFKQNVEELSAMRKRVLVYGYHCRETNIAATMRMAREIAERVKEELLSVLRADQANQEPGGPIDGAIKFLETGIDKFLKTYFVVSQDRVTKGYHSVTSR